MALLVGSASIFAYSQDTVTPEDAGKFIDRQKTVCGTVVIAHYATRKKGQPTLINFDEPYPNQLCTSQAWRDETHLVLHLIS